MTSEAARNLFSCAGFDAPTVTPLAGDASTRRYFRVSGPQWHAAVLMDCGAPLPEEGAGTAQDAFAFARWRDFYEALGLRVPRILGMDRPAGLVLLEDLGDELLQARLEREGVDRCRELYREAAALARVIAEEGTARFRPDAGSSDDPLVPPRLALEMDLFLAHSAAVPVERGPEALSAPLAAAARGLDAHEASAPARRLLHQLCADLHEASRAAGGSLTLCHRDFHARNLMVVPEDARDRLAILDFQDTRRGPRAYDLASLVHDPYVRLPTALVRELVESSRPARAEAADWWREVDLCAAQRLLKAAGSYAWLSRERGRREYERWLPVAIDRARERLDAAAWPPRRDLWPALRVAGVPLAR